MDEPSTITKIFHPILSPIFTPINNLLSSVYEPYATICAIGLFLSGIGLVFWLK